MAAYQQVNKVWVLVGVWQQEAGVCAGFYVMINPSAVT